MNTKKIGNNYNQIVSGNKNKLVNSDVLKNNLIKKDKILKGFY